MSLATTLRRTDTSILAQWWWTIDRTMLGAVAFLITVGVIMLFAASPSAALREGLPASYFIMRQMVVLPVGISLIFGLSLLPPLWIRRAGTLLLPVVILLLLATLVIGSANKGAQRWIVVSGFSLQASELLNPALAIASAWMFSEWKRTPGFPGWLIALGLYGLAMPLLLLQPDIGKTALVTAMWWTQFYLAGLRIRYLIPVIGLMVAGGIGAYHAFPHVQSRVDRFLDPESGDTFQIDRAVATFANGGWFGQGPGEGLIKSQLPDAHADFVFAVMGEEFGFLFCLIVLGAFVMIYRQGVRHIQEEKNLFVLLAVGGLLTVLMAQAFINVGSSLNLIPPKGMTLPFISYGGSSLLGTCITMGMLLGLTRSRATERLRS
jgi:cell division protein FtsW